eukprot:scaffold15235_cov61-Phaeocystis_antarctica.AAC.5
MAVIDQSLIVADALVVGSEDATAGKRCSRAHRLCVCGACALGNSIVLTGDRSSSPGGACCGRGACQGPDGDFARASLPNGSGDRHGHGA